VDASLSSDESVTVEMTNAEALVLFEWLHRNETADVRLDQLGLEDAAERATLWNLSGALEKLLAEPFASNYAELLEAARAKTRTGAE
jgi:hypothetical protein